MLKNNKALKIIFGVIKTLITVFLLVLICIIFIQRVFNNSFAIAGIRVFTVVSESMLPQYEIGDMIIAKETDASKINIGDNVVYNGLSGDFKGKVITHQVIEKNNVNNKYKFITKGINNDIADPEISESQIIGKVIYKTIILSFISKIVNNTATFFFAVFIPFVLLVFFEIINVIEEKDDDKIYTKEDITSDEEVKNEE